MIPGLRSELNQMTPSLFHQEHQVPVNGVHPGVANPGEVQALVENALANIYHSLPIRSEGLVPEINLSYAVGEIKLYVGDHLAR